MSGELTIVNDRYNIKTNNGARFTLRCFADQFPINVWPTAVCSRIDYAPGTRMASLHVVD